MEIYDEIIIGSGIAGLYWCYKTQTTNSKKFIILEQNGIIGGRIYDIEWNRHRISLGGGVIKSSNNITIDLAKKFNLELGKTVSKYYMVNTDTCNIFQEDNFYDLNEKITKYLKKIFIKNKKQIKKNKLTWNEFLELYVDSKISSYIKSNSLYKSFANADIESVFDNEIDELLRTKNFEILYIKQNAYTELLNKLIEHTPNLFENMITNCKVTQIIQDENFFRIITAQNKIYLGKKIILATESKTDIKFCLNPINNSLIDNLYKMVSGSNYIRIYSYHKNGHGLTQSYYTSGIIGKVILINENILMCCYTEDINATQLYNLFEKNSKLEQIDIIYKLLSNNLIPIQTKPDDIKCKFWPTGIHYNSINYNKDRKKEILENLIKSNIFVIGEAVADTHGWVNSALESVDFICELSS